MKVTLAAIAAVALATSLAACVNENDSESESEPNEHVGKSKQAQQAPPGMVLTFSAKYSSKLFINGVPVCGGDPNPLGWLIPGHFAAWTAFCAATALTYAENPPNDAAPNPLDARILGVMTASWNCQAGNPAPIGPAAAAPGGSFAGMEGPLVGIANATAVRNSILVNGTWGMVTSGHPNPLAEPSFQALMFRFNPDIWNKLTGTISCGVDANGRPTSRTVTNLQSTWFPSHKIWKHTPIANPASRLMFNVAQRALSDLWSLPPIPAP